MADAITCKAKLYVDDTKILKDLYVDTSALQLGITHTCDKSIPSYSLGNRLKVVKSYKDLRITTYIHTYEFISTR